MPADATRRAFVSAAGLGALALAAGCRGKGGSARVLKVANQKGSTKALLTAAGVLAGAPYRIEWSEFPAAQNLLEAVGSGAADVGLVGDAPFVFAYRNGSPVKAVSVQRSVGGREALGIAVPPGSPIRSPADLVGKKIASTRGSIGHYLLLAGLKRLGKRFDAIDIRFLNPSDGRAALASGAVDAWAIWDPYAAIAELSDGMRIVPVERSWTPGLGFVFASDRALRDKRPQLEDFGRRFATARRWGEAHREAYAQMLTGQTGLPIAATRRFLHRTVNVPVPIDAALIAEEQQIADLFHEAGLLARPVQVAPHFAPL